MPTFATFEWTVLSVLIAGLFVMWSYLQQLERLRKAARGKVRAELHFSWRSWRSVRIAQKVDGPVKVMLPGFIAA
jgi:hypothetical protein